MEVNFLSFMKSSWESEGMASTYGVFLEEYRLKSSRKGMTLVKILSGRNTLWSYFCRIIISNLVGKWRQRLTAYFCVTIGRRCLLLGIYSSWVRTTVVTCILTYVQHATTTGKTNTEMNRTRT